MDIRQRIERGRAAIAIARAQDKDTSDWEKHLAALELSLIDNKPSTPNTDTQPVIWGTGNEDQIRSLLVLREAELILAKSQLSGKYYEDWYLKNYIHDLEIKISDLKQWLAEAKKNLHGRHN